MTNPHDAALTAIFSNSSVKDENASLSAGRPIYRDREIVTIHMAGNRKAIAVFPAHDFDPQATAESLKHGGDPVTYAVRFNEQYMAFKNNFDQPLSGTPLAEAPFLTEARRRELRALKVHTIEALADLDGGPLRILGPGGREIKNQAMAYLQTAAGTADVTALAATVEELRRQLEGEKALRGQLEAEILKRQPVSQIAQEQQGGEQNSEDAKEPDDFTEFTDEELKDYIAEKTGQKPKGSPSRATLEAAAVELAKG